MLPPNSFFFALGADMLPVSASKPASSPQVAINPANPPAKQLPPLTPQSFQAIAPVASTIILKSTTSMHTSKTPRQAADSYSLRTSIHPTSTAILAHLRVNHQLCGPRRRQSEHLSQPGTNNRQIWARREDPGSPWRNFAIVTRKHAARLSFPYHLLLAWPAII